MEILLKFLSLYFMVCYCAKGAPTLRFPFGTIEGSHIQSRTSGKPVFAYYRVPFAEPPVGPLRFKAPVPFTGRDPSTVVSGTEIQEGCVQIQVEGTATASQLVGSEDCLYLNVFAPGAVSQAPRKVMVWIYGGGYMTGQAALYLPTDLVADRDVIVVTLHYRLAYFGFLPTGNTYRSGNTSDSNNGLRDQILALRWVKDNIAQFGGDPNDVTIFGQSAGSASVSFLSLSPHTKGLFSKAIMQSGTALSPWAMQTPRMARDQLWRIAERVGCLTLYSKVMPGGFEKSHNDIVECLRKVPAERFTLPASVMTLIEPDYRDQQFVGVIVDGDVLPAEPDVLLRNETHLRTNGVLARSYMLGTTNLEGRIYVMPWMAREPQRAFSEITDFTLNYTFPLNSNPELKHMVDFVYSYPRDSSGAPSIQSLTDLETDFNFVVPSVKFCSMLAAISPSTNIFYYLFDYFPQIVNSTERAPGTPHGTDLAYEFDRSPLTPMFLAGINIDLDTPEARTLTNVFRGVLTDFAKTGDPSGAGAVNWPRFELKKRMFLAISSKPEVRSRVYSQRVSLWQDYLPTISRPSTSAPSGSLIG